MNRRIQIAISFLCYCSFIGTVVAQITFERTYGGKFYDVGNNVIETPDNGFFIIGTTRSASNDTTDAYLLRIDRFGDTLWTDIYGGKLWDSGVSISPSSDEGYLLALASNSIHPGNYDIHLIKIRENGDKIWAKTFGGSDVDYVHSSQSTTDGGYIIQAHTLSYGMGSMDFYLLKVNQNGDAIWTKTFGGAESDWGGFVQQTSDQGYILTGDTQSFGDINGDIYLIKTDSLGNALWSRTYGGAQYDRAFHVLQTCDEGYLLSGITQSFGVTDHHGYIVRTNSMGDTLWTMILGGPHSCSLSYCEQCADGNYTAVGSISDTGFGKSDVYMVKFDCNAHILWTKHFGGVEHDLGKCIREAQDGGFIIVGSTQSFTPDSNDDVYIIKTDGAGSLTAVKETLSASYPRSTTFFENYPNPFNLSTKIILDLQESQVISVKIYDILGREIEALLSSKFMPAGRHELVWDAQHTSCGVYICQLMTVHQVMSSKMVCLK